jgi:hypothetical protein
LLRRPAGRLDGAAGAPARRAVWGWGRLVQLRARLPGSEPGLDVRFAQRPGGAGLTAAAVNYQKRAGQCSVNRVNDIAARSDEVFGDGAGEPPVS